MEDITSMRLLDFTMHQINDCDLKNRVLLAIAT